MIINSACKAVFRAFFWGAFALLFIPLALPAAAEGKRVALVIGNNAYENLSEDDQLKSAINDATLMKSVLESLGFKVRFYKDLDRDAFEDALIDFRGLVGKDDIAFFFYAGHGVAFGSGNYFLPSDIKPPESNRKLEEERIITKSISELDVIKGIQDTGAKVTIAVIDACRNNPLESSEGRSIGGSRGLTQVELSSGVLSIYSAGFNQRALDRLPNESDGVNSVFTRVFAKQITQKGTTLSEVARNTRNEVNKLASSAGYTQTPALYDQIVGDPIYLAGEPEKASAQNNDGDSAAKGNVSGQANPDQSKDWMVELGFWTSIQNSKDPQVFEQYIRQYPEGFYVDLARAKIDSLKREQEEQKLADQRRREEQEFWDSIKDSGAVDDFRSYQQKYPDGSHRGLAETKIEILNKQAEAEHKAEIEFWNTVKDSDNEGLLGFYINRYPNGEFVELAKAKLEKLKSNSERQAEEQLWGTVKFSNSISELRRYLNRYPNGIHAREARDKIGQIEDLDKKLRDQNEQAKRNSDPCRNYELAQSSGRDQAIKQIELYYQDLDQRNVECALGRWYNPSYKLSGLVSDFGGASVSNAGIVSYNESRGRLTATAQAQVRKQNGPWEYYNMRIEMVLRSGTWLISKMKARR